MAWCNKALCTVPYAEWVRTILMSYLNLSVPCRYFSLFSIFSNVFIWLRQVSVEACRVSGCGVRTQRLRWGLRCPTKIRSVRGLSSLSRGPARVPCIASRVLTTGPPGRSPRVCVFNNLSLITSHVSSTLFPCCLILPVRYKVTVKYLNPRPFDWRPICFIMTLNFSFSKIPLSKSPLSSPPPNSGSLLCPFELYFYLQLWVSLIALVYISPTKFCVLFY